MILHHPAAAASLTHWLSGEVLQDALRPSLLTARADDVHAVPVLVFHGKIVGRLILEGGREGGREGGINLK